MNRSRLTLISSVLLLVPLVQVAHADSPPPLISSVVYNYDGTPAKNVTVKMLLAPTTESTSFVKQTVIAKTTTDSAGNFSFGQPTITSDVVNAALANGGVLNVGIFSAPDVDTPIVSAPGSGAINNAPNWEFAIEYTSFNLQTQLNVPAELVPDDEADQLNPLTMEGVYTGDTNVDPSFSPPVENPETCDGPYVKRINTTYPWSPVVDLHTYLDMSATFYYGKTADSVAEVGFSRSSDSGWGSNSSIHVSNSSGSAVTWARGDHFARRLSTEFEVGEYDTVQYCPSQTYHYYQTMPLKWIPGTRDGTTDLSSQDGSSAFYRQPIGYRNNFSPKTTFDRDDSKGHSYSVGLTTPWGFSGSIRSGFSSHVHIHYAFGPANYTHNLFGRDGDANVATTIYAY